MAGRAISVYPAPDAAAPEWTARHLDASCVTGAGMELGGLGPAGAGLRVSAGVVAVLSRTLSTDGLTSAELLDAIGSVFGAVEVVGGDGASAALVSGGRGRPAADLDLALTGLVLEVDGAQVATAAGAAAGGHPATAAVRALAATKESLAEGTLVFTGRWTTPVPVASGSYLQASFAHLGAISVRVP